MNGNEDGGGSGDNGERTPPLLPSQDARRPFRRENLDAALRARTIAAMTPAINAVILGNRFLKDVPLWLTKVEEDVRARYKPGQDFTLLQNYLETIPEHEREEALAAIDGWLINKFAHERGTRPYLFVARGTNDFFITWTDFDPNRVPPPPAHRA